MVKVLKVPIIVRIINFYKKFGYEDFVIAGGYKGVGLLKIILEKI